MKRIFILPCLFLFFFSIFSPAGAEFFIDKCNNRLIQVNEKTKTYRVIFVIDKNRRVLPIFGGKTLDLPRHIVEEAGRLYLCQSLYMDGYVAYAASEEPSRILKKVDLNFDGAKKKYGCNLNIIRALKPLVNERLLVVCNTTCGEEYKPGTIFYVINFRDGSVSEAFSPGYFSDSSLLRGDFAYFMGISSGNLLKLNLKTMEISLRRLNFSANNVQLSPAGDSWWIFDEEKRIVVRYNPVDKKRGVYVLSVPEAKETIDCGYYLWNPEPFIFVPGGILFQVTHYYTSGADMERVDAVRKFFLYSFRNGRTILVAPPSVGGGHIGTLKTAGGWVIFSRIFNLRLLRVMELSDRFRVKFTKDFPMPDEEFNDSYVEIGKNCVLFRCGGKVFMYSVARRNFIPLKEVMAQ